MGGLAREKTTAQIMQGYFDMLHNGMDSPFASLKQKLDILENPNCPNILDIIAPIFETTSWLDTVAGWTFQNLCAEEHFIDPISPLTTTYPSVLTDGGIIFRHKLLTIFAQMFSNNIDDKMARHLTVLGFSGNHSLIKVYGAGQLTIRMFEIGEPFVDNSVADKAVSYRDMAFTSETPPYLMDGRRQARFPIEVVGNPVLLHATILTPQDSQAAQIVNLQTGKVLQMTPSASKDAAILGALAALRELDVDLCEKSCINCLKASAFFVRIQALRLLIELKGPKAIPHIREIIASETNDLVLDTAKSLLNFVEKMELDHAD